MDAPTIPFHFWGIFFASSKGISGIRPRRHQEAAESEAVSGRWAHAKGQARMGDPLPQPAKPQASVQASRRRGLAGAITRLRGPTQRRRPTTRRGQAADGATAPLARRQGIGFGAPVRSGGLVSRRAPPSSAASRAVRPSSRPARGARPRWRSADCGSAAGPSRRPAALCRRSGRACTAIDALACRGARCRRGARRADPGHGVIGPAAVAPPAGARPRSAREPPGRAPRLMSRRSMP
jgi:hypothetical protein